MQGTLADLFVDIANAGQRVVIETHSEHLLLRLRRLVAEGQITPEQVALYFVEREDEDRRFARFSIESNGHIPREEWPKEFFHDALRESLALASAKQVARVNRPVLEDIVIDTNVLMHANNPSSGRQQQAVELISAMLGASTALCLDAVFVGDLAQPKSSLIEHEYMENLGAPSIGSEFLIRMASTGRIVRLPRTVEEDARQWINRQIGNPRDRTFIRVTVNSSERVLVSHDFQDFPTDVRAGCSSSLMWSCWKQEKRRLESSPVVRSCERAYLNVATCPK